MREIRWRPSNIETQKGLQALSDPTRRAIVSLLARSGPQAVGAIHAQFDVSWSGISRHLGILKGAGIVEAERHGKQVIYNIQPDSVRGLGEACFDLVAPTQAISPEMFEPLQALRDLADEEARALRHEEIATDHLLLAILRDKDAPTSQVLRAWGVTHRAARKIVRDAHDRLDRIPDPGRPWGVAASNVVVRAPMEAVRLGQVVVGRSALLMALLAYRNEAACHALESVGVDPVQLRERFPDEWQAVAARSHGGEDSPEVGRLLEDLERTVDALRTAVGAGSDR